MLVGEGLVGNDLLLVHHEAVVLAVGQLGVQLGLLAGQRGERHLQPYHVLAGLEHVAHPVGRPGVVEDGLAGLVARDGVGDQRRVGALLVGHGVAQLVGRQVMLDHGLAAPARRAAGEVGLAVAVRVEQLGDLGVLELAEVGDLVFVGRLLVHQVALGGVVRVHALAEQLGVAARVLVVVGVQRVPVRGQESGIAIGNRHVGRGVLDLLEGLHVVAQLLQGLHDDEGLEALFGDGALQWQHLHALSGLFVGRPCAGAGQRNACGDGAGAQPVAQCVGLQSVGVQGLDHPRVPPLCDERGAGGQRGWPFFGKAAR
ncbi:hypothetical protein SAMN05421547_11519 [Delftia lacustris]|uniref:Uncharacterized protein n=1 Tax=Delftia lacustris TaxID=558537 RepID=A0A1H3RAP9_9BURK|nr:hypothetical protein SAMN05421547_11519 [Delftia lacustris]